MTSSPVVVVDCDPGLDDALALLALAQLVQEGKVAVPFVTAVAGNAPLQVTARNAAYVLSHSALSGALVLAEPLSPGAPAQVRPDSIHGPDGLGGLAWVGNRLLVEDGAVPALANALRDGTAILAIGPLTNVARALSAVADADLGRRARIVVMGGGSGSSQSDFNLSHDPVSAEAVLASGHDVTLVPLDVTRRVGFTIDDVDLLRHSAANGLVADLLDAILRAHERVLGMSHCHVHDAVALMAVVRPDLVTCSDRADGGSGRVVVDCNVEGIKQTLLGLWAATPSVPDD